MSHRNGLMLILVGLGLAGLTSVLVMGIVRQATEASRAPIRQVALVAGECHGVAPSLIGAGAPRHAARNRRHGDVCALDRNAVGSNDAPADDIRLGVGKRGMGKGSREQGGNDQYKPA